MSRPGGAALADSGSAISAGGDNGGPNRKLLTLQSATSCGSTFGNSLRALAS